MAFHEVRLPTSLSLGARGGPGFKTTITPLASGVEQRNQDWQDARARYNIGFSVRTKANYQTLLDFFVGRRGRFHGFRFKDRIDFEATDEEIGTGDDTTAAFQLVKTYDTLGDDPYVRDIKKPVDGTVTIKVDSTTKTETTHYTIDYTTGVVTFTGGNIPTAGQSITWSGEFDVPVRFDTDLFDSERPLPDLAGVPDVILVELKL